MPVKYRQIGDFHEYYSGQKLAPYLTLFLGGNHEASNYLFELYHGGWVAPNIYYLGAANVLRLGPLRISGISGIWKGYDYRKPHFERLPYNKDDVQSVYHVRELDARKLLQVRSQVDVGLSHDWPQGIEKFGDHHTLFKKKRGFQADSDTGRLGSVAAREVLEHLRPSLWFSAHLHVRFTALRSHDTLTPIHNAPECARPNATSLNPATESTHGHDDSKEPQSMDEPSSLSAGQRKLGVATGDVASRIAAWQEFGQVAHQQEMADQASFMAAFKERQASGVNTGKHITFEETLKIGKGPIQKFVRGANGERIPTSTGDVADADLDPCADIENIANADKVSLSSSPSSTTSAPLPSASTKIKLSEDDAAAVENDDRVSLGTSPKSTTSVALCREDKGIPKSTLPSDWVDGASDWKEPEIEAHGLVDDDLLGVASTDLPTSLDRPPTPVAVSKVLPTPEQITNKLTKFLTLDKPRNHDPFVELMEIDPISKDDTQYERPYRFQYDKEWLAITRVFAEELELGDVNASVPAHKGYEHYQKRIAEEETWVQNNIVEVGLLDIPENFVQTAPVFDPSVEITTDEQPIEYTNPQTEKFCRLVQITNKFDLPDEERRARMDAGPRPCRPRDSRPGHGRGGRGNRGGWRGRTRGRGRGGHHKRGG